MDKYIKKECRIKHFPVSFFSVILGMTGFAVAFQKAEQVLEISVHLSRYILALTLVFFVVISIVYLIKVFRFRNEVNDEFNHPIKLSFFPTFSVSLLLLSVAFVSVDSVVSKYFWISGTIIHFILTIKVISVWIQHTKFDIKHMNPAWFIPAVGNILVPIAGVNHFSSEVPWFFYSVGLLFWIILLVIFFNRIVFHSPLPDKLLPTLFILIAPPAVGFISFVKLTGEVNEFAKILYYFGLFLTCLLFAQLKMFSKIKYYLSWWAYSFPIAAITIASIVMFQETGIDMFRYISLFFFGILNLIISILLIKTGMAIFRKQICVEEE